MFELNPPQRPLSEVNTTHKWVFSCPVPCKSFGAFSLSDTELERLRIILFIFSEYGLPLSAFSCALLSFAAATIFIAFVIFCVDLTLEILFFKSSKLAITFT